MTTVEERIKREAKTWRQLANEYYVKIKDIPGATFDEEYQRKAKPISNKLWIPQKKVLQILSDYHIQTKAGKEFGDFVEIQELTAKYVFIKREKWRELLKLVRQLPILITEVYSPISVEKNLLARNKRMNKRIEQIEEKLKEIEK